MTIIIYSPETVAVYDDDDFFILNQSHKQNTHSPKISKNMISFNIYKIQIQFMY